MKTITLILVCTSLMFPCIHSQALDRDGETAEATRKVGEIVQGTTSAVLGTITNIFQMFAPKPPQTTTQPEPITEPKQSTREEKIDRNKVTELEPANEANTISTSDEEEINRRIDIEYKIIMNNERRRRKKEKKLEQAQIDEAKPK